MTKLEISNGVAARLIFWSLDTVKQLTQLVPSWFRIPLPLF